VPRNTESDRVKKWFDRIRQSNKLYNQWSDRYETDRLEKYYLGEQWRGVEEDIAKNKYTINMVYSTVETNRPALIFNRPQIRLQPRPGRADDMGTQIQERAKLAQDTVQTFVDDPDIEFGPETALSLQEAHFKFGVIEVGYTSNPVDNPNADKPQLKEDSDDPITDKQGNEVLEPDRLVEHESLFVRRVPAKTFRVSLSSCNSLKRNDWCGYYEWQYLEDLKSNDNYKTKNIKPTGTVKSDLQYSDDPERLDHHHGMVRIWKIWDIRSGVKHVLAEGHDKFLIEGEKYSFLPFADIKLHEILDSYYPMPPVYQWLGPQDEVNETRDMQRAHRRKFIRRYTVDPGVDDEELKKLETGEDGVYARISAAQAPRPIADAPLSSDVWRGLDESKADFVVVSGVTSEQRGIAESETATQATILDARGRLRESAARVKVGDWLAAIARLILFTIRENMVLPFWIQRNVDMIGANEEEIQSIAEKWQQIQSIELGDMDLDAFVDLASLSPVTEEVQRNSWNQVIALLANPAVAMIMAQSEVLLRKTVSLYGIRSETEIREIQQVAQSITQMAVDAQQAEAGGAGGGGGSAGPNAAAPGSPPPGMEEMLARMASVNRQT
jgi:hypothetical protein